LNSAYVPYSDRRKKDKEKIVGTICDFAFQVMAEQIPCKNHFLKRYKVLDFEKLESKKLCETISPKGDLAEFAEANNLTENETVKYLIALVEFVIDQEEEELLGKKSSNKSKQRIYKIKGLKIDRVEHRSLKDGYDEKLKDIYFSLSDNECRESLLHKEFESVNNLIEKDNAYDFKELTKDTDEKF
jgi:hypothetical protein